MSRVQRHLPTRRQPQRPKVHRRRGTRVVTVVTSMALAALGLSVGVLQAAAAVADPDPVVERPADMVTADSLPTAQINGVAWAQVIVGNTVFVGGSFTTSRPAGAAAGQSTTPRANLMSYDITTGTLKSFAPVLNGQVLGLAASPDGSKLYVVGDFTTVDGITRNHVAVFDAVTGALSPVTINIATQVRAVVATNSTLYVGGLFTAANGQLRNRLAAFDAANGALLGWNPGADQDVRALVVTPDGSRVIAGGAVRHRRRPARVRARSDRRQLRRPAAVGGEPEGPQRRRQLRDHQPQHRRNLYFGTGYVFGSGGNLEGTFKADPNTGAIGWIEDCHGDTYSAYSTGQAVYTVSHAHYCGNVGGFPQSDPWSTNQRRAIAWTNAPAGTIYPDPLGYFNWAGNPRPSMINWFPILLNGTYTGQGQAAWSVTGNGEYVVMGGEFPTVNGIGQQGLSRFAVKAVSGAKMGPSVTGARFMPSVTTRSTGTARIAFQANSDPDDSTLTYSIVRNSLVSAPIYITTVSSTFWNRPNIGFTDTGLTPGVPYRYRL